MTPPPARPAPQASWRDALLEPRTQALALFALGAVILFARSGQGTLANYDDCYYAEKAKEMLRTGDWLTPHFSGRMTLDNPPLFLWIIAACFAVMGRSDWSAIFGSALSGVLAVTRVHRLAARLGRDGFEAFVAAGVLLTTGYFLKYAGHAMFDVFLTLLFVFAMEAYRDAYDGRWRGWLVLGVCAGLGVLTKSVLGLFPLIVVGLHLLWQRRLFTRAAAGLALAFGVTLLVIAPWYGAQLGMRPAQFLHQHVGWLLWERGFVIGRAQQTLASRFAYVTEIATLYWPWLPFALAGLWSAAREAFGRPAGATGDGWDDRATSRLLVLWPVVVIGVMSLGNEKKLWYVMSAFPALALLAARAIGGWVRDAHARRRVVLGGFAVLTAAAAFLALTPFGRPVPRRADLQMMAHAARTLVPRDSTLALGAGSYSSVAHQFVYYSDHFLDDPLDDPAQMRAQLDRGRWALLDAGHLASAVGTDTLRYAIVARSGIWALVHAAPHGAVELSTRDPWE